jgi:tetratricopeptide (TPR) repeat protein
MISPPPRISTPNICRRRPSSTCTASATATLLHTDGDVKRHSPDLAPLFREAGQGRMWLVAGYSGENDPVFEHLEAVERFPYNLTWARYEDEDPPPHLTKNLLKPGKGTLYLRGYDADRLFVELAQRLDCFPPDFISAPFQHLRDTLNRVGPFQLPHKAGQLDIVQEARKLIDHAESVVRDVADTTRERVLLAMSRGDYEEAVRDVSDGAIAAQDYELRGMVATAHLMLGVRSQDKSEIVCSDERVHALNTAINHYKNGLAIKPDYPEAFYDWGIALYHQAIAKSGEDAQRFFDLTGQKYAQAIAIKPDYRKAFYNWGNALYNQAIAKSGEDAQRLFDLAGQKYAQAIAIKPDFLEALFNLACLNGRRRDETACRALLTRCLYIPHPDTKRLLAANTEFDAMRDKPWFQEMLAAL